MHSHAPEPSAAVPKQDYHGWAYYHYLKASWFGMGQRKGQRSPQTWRWGHKRLSARLSSLPQNSSSFPWRAWHSMHCAVRATSGCVPAHPLVCDGLQHGPHAGSAVWFTIHAHGLEASPKQDQNGTKVNSSKSGNGPLKIFKCVYFAWVGPSLSHFW